MADGTCTKGTGAGAGGIAGIALDEPGIQRLARAAAAIAIKGDRVLRLGFVKVGREHIEQVRAKIESAAAQIVRDYLDQTPRGVRRAARQRRAGADPAGVLIPERLAAVVANAMRDARRAKRPPRRKAGAETWRDVPSMPVGDRGDPGLVDSRRPDAAEVEEIADPYPLGDPLLWLLALDAAADAEADAEAEGRCPVALTEPRPRARRPKPILHLKRRAAAGGAS
ncbi:hypothetical protein [Metallibacterium sp.]|uniref:hypothetical protein n=1 Tax=Metallibacterium sp. TaxID=2940281 RepID=UPI0026261E99|nr:hypothetical protein [Metallibacterium sp.]